MSKFHLGILEGINVALNKIENELPEDSIELQAIRNSLLVFLDNERYLDILDKIEMLTEYVCKLEEYEEQEYPFDREGLVRPSEFLKELEI